MLCTITVDQYASHVAPGRMWLETDEDSVVTIYKLHIDYVKSEIVRCAYFQKTDINTILQIIAEFATPEALTSVNSITTEGWFNYCARDICIGITAVTARNALKPTVRND